MEVQGLVAFPSPYMDVEGHSLVLYVLLLEPFSTSRGTYLHPGGCVHDRVTYRMGYHRRNNQAFCHSVLSTRLGVRSLALQVAIRQLAFSLHQRWAW